MVESKERLRLRIEKDEEALFGYVEYMSEQFIEELGDGPKIIASMIENPHIKYVKWGGDISKTSSLVGKFFKLRGIGSTFFRRFDSKLIQEEAYADLVDLLYFINSERWENGKDSDYSEGSVKLYRLLAKEENHGKRWKYYTGPIKLLGGD